MSFCATPMDKLVSKCINVAALLAKSCLLNLALVGCILLVAECAAATTPTLLHLQGVVVDQNGSPINDALVSLKHGLRVVKNTRTNTNGEFSIETIDVGPLTLAVNSPGFATAELELTPATTTFRIVLNPSELAAEVTIIATRTETRVSETAASVVELSASDLQTTAAATLDDALRQVPGFSLFRRSGSRTANPTSQGVSLRGLGASGASRALVMADGVPLNDPFGGWVYWDRVPRESIRQVEILLGGASHLYGSAALGGVIDISTSTSAANTFSLTASYGNETTPNASVYLSGTKHNWTGSIAAETFHTDGFVLIPANQRGLIDTPAGSRSAVLNLRLEKTIGNEGRLFGAASFFGEARENGTPLQTNRTHIRQFVFGGNWQENSIGSLSARVYGDTQVFDQNFTAVSTDRNSELLTRVQRVPAQVVGFSGQWTRALGQRQTLIAGIEIREVRGASDELAFVNGRASSFIGAGGRERTTGLYVEDLIRLRPDFLLTASLRMDHWRNFAALSAARPINVINPTSVIRFADRVENAFSPQLGALYRVNAHLSITASMSRAFRAPTLNELYRSFRVGNVLTLANEQLRAERATSGEAGARWNFRNEKLAMRGTFFWNEIKQPIANVTLQTIPALITRQRENLGRTRSRGFELQTEAMVSKSWDISAGYMFANARVVEFPANRSLEGLLIPQVAPHQLTFQARYNNPSIVTLSFQGRAASKQFDDDQNAFRLDPYFTLDVFLSRRLNHRLELFCATENIFNQRYQVGKTPLITLGPPLLLRGGFNLRLGKQ